MKQPVKDTKEGMKDTRDVIPTDKANGRVGGRRQATARVGGQE